MRGGEKRSVNSRGDGEGQQSRSGMHQQTFTPRRRATIVFHYTIRGEYGTIGFIESCEGGVRGGRWLHEALLPSEEGDCAVSARPVPAGPDRRGGVGSRANGYEGVGSRGVRSSSSSHDRRRL